MNGGEWLIALVVFMVLSTALVKTGDAYTGHIARERKANPYVDAIGELPGPRRSRGIVGLVWLGLLLVFIASLIK